MHFGHDKVTVTNSVSLKGRCYKMKGRKAIRNARPKATFEKEGHKFLGSGNYNFTYCKTSNNVPPLIIPAPLKFQKNYQVILAKIFRGNRLTARKNNMLN